VLRPKVLPFAVLLVACGSTVDLGDTRHTPTTGKSVPGQPRTSVFADAGSGGTGAIGASGVQRPDASAGTSNIITSPRPDGGARGGFSGQARDGGRRHDGGGVEVARCRPIATTPGVFNPCGDTWAIAYSPDAKLLVTGEQTPPPNVFLWNLSDGSLVRELDGIERGVYDVAFSPDGSLLAVSGEREDGTGDISAVVKIYDVASGRQVLAPPTSCGFYVDSVAFSNDGTLLATAGYRDFVELWRVADGTLVHAIPYATSVHNVHFAPMGSELIIGGYDEKATVYSVPGGSEVFSLSPIATEQADAAFSPDGTQIASTGDGPEQKPEADVIKLWDVSSRQLLQTLSGHQGYVSHVVWIDQDHLVSNDWIGTVRRWNRQPKGLFAAGDVWTTNGARTVAVSPDKKTLAVDAVKDGVPGFEFLSL
jgi:WD40 repeat protein